MGSCALSSPVIWGMSNRNTSLPLFLLCTPHPHTSSSCPSSSSTPTRPEQPPYVSHHWPHCSVTRAPLRAVHRLCQSLESPANSILVVDKVKRPISLHYGPALLLVVVFLWYSNGEAVSYIIRTQRPAWGEVGGGWLFLPFHTHPHNFTHPSSCTNCLTAASLTSVLTENTDYKHPSSVELWLISQYKIFHKPSHTVALEYIQDACLSRNQIWSHRRHRQVIALLLSNGFEAFWSICCKSSNL